MAEFKRLSDVEVVAEPTESANVLIEENGVIKKAPKTAVGGAGGEPDMVITLNCRLNSIITAENVTITSGDIRKIFDKLWAGEPVDIRIREIVTSGSYEANANEIRARGTYYGGDLFVHYICTSMFGSWVYTKRITIQEDGTIGNIVNECIQTTAQS